MIHEYTIVDLETTVRCPISSKGHPMWPDNQIVKVGIVAVGLPDRPTRDTYISPNLVNGAGSVWATRAAEAKDMFTLRLASLVVGHNIKFDLLYVLRNGWLSGKELMDLQLWDTQHVEYLLSAQQHTYPSLDDCSVKYGGSLKDDRIKEFWDNDIPTEHIPEEMLGEYLQHDLMNTEIVYLAQRKKVEAWGMTALVKSQMRALAAATLMEFNGMQIDRTYIVDKADDLAKRITIAEALLSSYTEHISPEYGGWQWSSPKDVSALFFGTEYKVKAKELVGKYKNGKDKWKSVLTPHYLSGVCKKDPLKMGATANKLGYWTTDDVVLKNLAKEGFEAAQFILDLRMLSKQRETYFINLSNLCFPDGRIHANLNMCSTKTGRLSCNKPNIQNQTVEGGIKDAYVSRWGVDGVLVDFDYSQLEMAGLASVANDTQLAYDINHGIDMHNELYKGMYGRYPSKEERKKFKSLSFGLVYGAGSKTLAANADCSIADAKKFIEVFYSRYKGVAAWHKRMVEEANKERRLTKEHTPKGHPVGAFLKRMPTGRLYLFKEYDNDWKGEASFSPTELKNWPVQGFATGDIVPHMVGEVVQRIYAAGASSYALPIMTVHDSLVFDVKKTSLDKFIKACKIVLSNTTGCVEKHFSISLPVKLSVGCSTGPTWGTQSEVDLSTY